MGKYCVKLQSALFFLIIGGYIWDTGCHRSKKILPIAIIPTVIFICVLVEDWDQPIEYHDVIRPIFTLTEQIHTFCMLLVYCDGYNMSCYIADHSNVWFVTSWLESELYLCKPTLGIKISFFFTVVNNQ